MGHLSPHFGNRESGRQGDQAPSNHANKAMPVEPALSRTDDCLKKIPEPMTVPTTNDRADQKPSDRFRVVVCFEFCMKSDVLAFKLAGRHGPPWMTEL